MSSALLFSLGLLIGLLIYKIGYANGYEHGANNELNKAAQRHVRMKRFSSSGDY
jgi:hypothetical protein